MKDYIIYSLKLANYLANKGYQIKKTAININNPKYNVYYFEDLPELRAEVENFKSALVEKPPKGLYDI